MRSWAEERSQLLTYEEWCEQVAQWMLRSDDPDDWFPKGTFIWSWAWARV